VEIVNTQPPITNRQFVLCDEYSLNKRLYNLEGKPGSSVNVEFGYGLDDRVIDVRSPATAKGRLL
jgi:hypothetical protein